MQYAPTPLRTSSDQIALSRSLRETLAPLCSLRTALFTRSRVKREHIQGCWGTFICKPRLESGLDCLVCDKFARVEMLEVNLLLLERHVEALAYVHMRAPPPKLSLSRPTN